MNLETQRVLDFNRALHVKLPNTILIVEDEKLVAWDIEQTLREFDYNDIFQTTSIAGARKIVSSAKDQIALVILDLKVDDGDASILIDEFMEHEIKVLVVTGYNGFTHTGVPVLCKPFSSGALLQAVSSLFSNRSRSRMSVGL